jgi:uncharacterized protein (TIGR02186 family)
MKKTYITGISAILFFIAACLVSTASAAGVPVKLHVEPNAIHIGATYNGIDIAVQGEVPDGTDVVIRLMAKGEHVRLKKKGKALGLLWMNMDTIELHDCPSIFMVAVPKSLSPSTEESRKKWENLELGFKALEKQVEITPEQKDKSTVFKEFIKLKKKEGKYLTYYDSIKYSTSGGVRKFSTTLAMPAGIVAGEYRVQAFAVKDGTVAGKADTTIRVTQVGLPAMLSNLAFNHSLLYGIMAVIIAIFAGLITGVLFKGGKGAH